MNKVIMNLMVRKNRLTMNDFVQPKMGRSAKRVFMVSLEDSKKDQDKIRKSAAAAK